MSSRDIVIGGVTFNKNDVKSSQVVKKDGQELNSVFLKDGTHLEFPTQSKENEAIVHQQFGTKKVTRATGNKHVPVRVDTVEDRSYRETTIERMSDTKITGTANKDVYTLKGCKDSKVDVSHNDRKLDEVTIVDSRAKSIFGHVVDGHSSGKTYTSSGNEISLNKDDKATVKNNNREHWYEGEVKTKKGPGTVKE